MNIEEIKERISNLTNDGIWFSMHTEDLMGSCGYDEPDSLGWVKGGKTDVGQNIDFVVNAKKDIEYLLSIIEQAEKALITSSKLIGDYKQETETSGAYTKCENGIIEIDEALKSIRGN
jgi:hypothetical protein